MAKMRINYNDYAAGTAPSSDFVWRQNNGTGGTASIMNSVDGNLLRTNSTGPGTKVLAYTPLDDVDDVEALVQFRLEKDFGKQGIISLRYGGTSEANTTGYTLSGSVIENVGKLAIDEGSTGYVIWADWNYLPNITYWARFRVVGARVSAKVWTDGQPEPSTWLLDVNSTHRASGDYSGFHQYNVGWINYFYTSFGTGGDTAPNPGDSIGTGEGEARVITSNDIEWDPTNNYHSGRPVPVSDIALHWWDDPAVNPTLEGVVSWFKTPSSQVSAHFVVSGETIVQMVSLDDQAWHVIGHNTYTIGIEVDPNFPPGTYETLAGLIRYLRILLNKPLPAKGHNEFSGTNTQCPGTMDIPLVEAMSQQPLPEGVETVPPEANFTASPTTGAYPLLVSFIDTSTHTPETWFWNFGDSENIVSEYGFEDGTLAPFTTGGNAGWSVVTGVSKSGTRSAKSGAIGDGQISNLTLSVTMDRGGIVKFDYKVSSELNFDNLRFYIDNAKKADWSGEIDWQTSKLFFIPEGTHELRWSFERDLAAGGGSNAAWVDNISITEASIASTSYDRNPIHTYADPGVYSVSLMAVNANGSNIITKEDFITVTEPEPVAPELPDTIVKTWRESRWYYDHVKQWNGTKWVKRPIKRWNGNNWH